ncbi:FUSC family protein [Desulforamulus hydrothermalis]|uniref:Membrane protein-like protein n=1 Tax=Desulforamulus hydrothermalis Lam5 = DSM 18033 TaxID=1121428 RepID=K8DY79_9FIRM|nr:aromatic acid exporter family protein [Desulforamulus hydrothermalis]CCO07650.1 Membrane protein-like protein [Desulforamulus hydrothermalis Lam5 = DSM 18033]SHH24538.1 Aromatic acid exporter family member 1 [Desulforamulus hydrothermalis Lam5 = DSM 18033]
MPLSGIFHFVGARILKTGIAVALSMYICTLLQIEPKVFAAVSAVINVQPSIYRSFRNAVEQVITHIISVLIAVICGYTFGTGPIIMGLVTVLIISTNVKLNLKQGISMGVVAGIFVLDAPQHDFLQHALTRSYVIFIGLGSALFINSFLSQPRYSNNFLVQLAKLNELTAGFFTELVKGFIKLEPLNRDEYEKKRAEIKEVLAVSKNLFALHKEQNRYLKHVPQEMQELWEKYLDFNVKLFYKSQEIYSATEQRLIWRMERGNPPISDEFNMVLAMLERGIASFEKLNEGLSEHVSQGKPLPPVQVNEQFWEELSFFIDQWHSRLTGADFLHAFMYVSVVANDIKWASRSIKDFSLTQRQDKPTAF